MEAFFFLILILLAIPVIIFAVEIFLAVFLGNRATLSEVSMSVFPTTVILIPAHNESSNIVATLRSIQDQRFDQLSVLVVADNCDDDTASIVKNENIGVIERHNSQLRGKGYALDFGIQYLAKNHPPEVVVILDADCTLGNGALAILLKSLQTHRRPIQACYQMYFEGVKSFNARIVEFAWLVKNSIRPLGLHALNLPCHLMGTGMAFTWEMVSKVSFANGNLVEDMKLGVDLCKAGYAPLFCPASTVISQFPLNQVGLKTQRTRWEHGHLTMIIKEGPRLLLNGCLKRDLHQISMSLDMMVPPFALLFLLVFTMFLTLVLFNYFTGLSDSLCLVIIYLIVIALAVTTGWYRFARQLISFKELLMAPIYVASKIPLYLNFIVKRQVEWVRTKRDS